MYNGKFYKEGDYIVIIIPEGKTMIQDGQEIPAPNWTTSIHISDTASLSEYLTQEQINQLGE